MSNRLRILLFGGEGQAAISMALAYPNIDFYCLRRKNEIIAGEDLDNFYILDSIPEEQAVFDKTVLIDLDSSLMYQGYTGQSNLCINLREIMDGLVRSGFNQALILRDDWGEDDLVIQKGISVHKRDATVYGRFAEVKAEKGKIDLSFQEYIPNVERTLLVTGYTTSDTIKIGVFDVLSEVQAFNSVLLGCESVENPKLIKETMSIIDLLNYNGFFTAVWIQSSTSSPALTSFRPIPSPLFQSFLSGGIDLLNHDGQIGMFVLKAGVKTTFDISYNPYSI